MWAAILSDAPDAVSGLREGPDLIGCFGFAGCSFRSLGSLGGRSFFSLAAFEELALPLGQRLFRSLGGAGGALVAGDEALSNGVGNNAGEQVDGADGVVVARDREVNFVGIAVGVQDGNNRDVQLLGFVDSKVFLLGVNNPQNRRGPWSGCGYHRGWTQAW
ncbi:hypothetical protein StoSoilB13_38080 (plasmid) [Arthrobacter sp. StoSoilB13]|nr:hypothetical protein StoSoilB13_38080 [Arthrobacter sp. StoSoilB13]